MTLPGRGRKVLLLAIIPVPLKFYQLEIFQDASSPETLQFV